MQLSFNKGLYFVLMAFVIVTAGTVANAQETLTVTFTPEKSGHFSPNHCVAVWLEDEQGNFVKTIDRRAGVRWHSLRDWQAASGFDMDAVTAATCKEYALLTVESNIETIPDGVYIVQIETAEDENPAPGINHRTVLSFYKNGRKYSQNPTGVKGFGDVSLNYSGRAVTENIRPGAYAGKDISISLSDSLYLNNTVSDDGKPTQSLTPTWIKVSGPGEVTFEREPCCGTFARFYAPGIYVLRLTADDGELKTIDEVTVEVNVVTVTCVEDSQVQKENPDKNQNGDFRVRIFNLDALRQSEGYIKFDLSAVKGDIVSATFQLTLNDGNPTQRDVVGIDDDSWSASTITWNNRPTEGTLAGTFGYGDGWIEVDVTDYVRSEHKNDAMMTFRVMNSATDSSFMRFNAQETYCAPRLKITMAE